LQVVYLTVLNCDINSQFRVINSNSEGQTTFFPQNWEFISRNSDFETHTIQNCEIKSQKKKEAIFYSVAKQASIQMNAFHKVYVRKSWEGE